jgi:hypothetical protein
MVPILHTSASCTPLHPALTWQCHAKVPEAFTNVVTVNTIVVGQLNCSQTRIDDNSRQWHSRAEACSQQAVHAAAWFGAVLMLVATCCV